MTIIWKNYQFENIPNRTLYEILKLRQAIFIVEQACPYLDCDGLDPLATHLCGFEENTEMLISYARIFPAGVLEQQAATIIGRVIVATEFRGQGIAYELMRQAEQVHPSQEYYLGAQAHLEGFYSKAGYKRAGNSYDEDGIPHLPMKKQIFPE